MNDSGQLARSERVRFMEWLTDWFSKVSADFYKCFIREDRYLLLWDGFRLTVRITLLAIVLGLILGFLIALCNISKIKPLRAFGKAYTDVIRGTPSVTQLMIVYFVIFATVRIDKWIIASIAFGINSAGYVAEIFRAGILSIDKGQTEAGRSLGLSASQTMIHIVFPQAFKNIFPALGNEFITLIKETAIVGYIGLMDIQKAGDFIKTASFQALMPLVGVAIIYFVVIKIMTILLGFAEKRLRRADRK